MFAEAVDPRLVRLDVLTAHGGVVPGPVPLTSSGGDVEVVEFALPALSDGVYGLVWVTVGPDGHRVAGEVVVGVGNLDGGIVTEAGFQDTAVLDHALGALAGIGRYVWYVGLALVAGALTVVGWWLRRRGAWSTAATASAGAVLVGRAGRVLRSGALVLLVGTALRATATVTLVARGSGSGSGVADVRLALVDAMGLLLILAAVGSAVLAVVAPRLANTESGLALLQGALGLVAIVALGSATSHTSILSDDPFGILVSTLHVSAASVWLGPLLLVAWTARGRSWRAEPASARAAVLRDLFRWFAPVAIAAFVVLGLTGTRSAWLLAGAEFFSGSAYAVVLLVKLALVVVVVLPIALRHDRRVGWLAGRRWACTPRGRMTRRSLSLEAGALGTVLAVTAVLAGCNPAVFSGDGPTGSSAFEASDSAAAPAGDTGPAELSALLSDEFPEDVAECAGRGVGQANCYRDYFSGVMRRDGVDVALTEVALLAVTDNYVARDCHQVVHDLGNDAAVWYGDIGVALAYEGFLCASGYYHGVIEYAISQFDGTALYDEVPNICQTAALNRYSLAHYNCVHGLGHGIMLNTGGDLFGSIPYCERLVDPWELSSCISGIMMENIVSAQQGKSTAVRVDDLIYPCNAIAESYVDECFGMQTAWMLTQLGYTEGGFTEAFATCDTVRDDMIDACYRSMGRDISGFAVFEVSRMVDLCSLGHPRHQEQCYVGAAMSAVYNDHDTATATALCEAIPPHMRDVCYAARDEIARTF